MASRDSRGKKTKARGASAASRPAQKGGVEGHKARAGKRASGGKKSVQGARRAGGVKQTQRAAGTKTNLPERRRKDATLKTKPQLSKQKAPELAKREATKARLALEAEREKQRLAKEKERLKLERERESQRLAKERAQQAALRDKLRQQKQRDKERLDKEREREKALKGKLQQQKQRDIERQLERSRREKEAKREQLVRERSLAKASKTAELLASRGAREAEKARVLAEREAQRDAVRSGREQEKAQLKADRETEKTRQKAAREAERVQLKVEKEAERERKREETRQRKEDERREREEARAAFSKAKQAELARIRAEREAAKRALEGKIAQAASRNFRLGGSRSSTTTRVYTPASIPNQSRTGRRDLEDSYAKFANLRPPQIDPAVVVRQEPEPPPPPPPPPADPPKDLAERFAIVQQRLTECDASFRKEYEENLLMSWIFHDSALEGVVYTYEELRTAINPNISVVPESSLQSVCEEIRRHKQAVELVQELGEKKRVPLSLDVLRKIFLTLHPEEGDLKSVKYRKDIPQHRLYFHEYSAPDKIAYKVRQVFDWLNGPEPKRLKSPLRVAARIHFDLLNVFPFASDSGKVIRLLMNVLLLRSDYPPAIIHSAERQRYYEALRGSVAALYTMLKEAVVNALLSIEKKLDERDTRKRPFLFH